MVLEKQKDCVSYATENEVLCILPAGYGKTLIQSLPFLTADSSTIVVVNGTRSILEKNKPLNSQKNALWSMIGLDMI